MRSDLGEWGLDLKKCIMPLGKTDGNYRSEIIRKPD